MNRIIDEGNGEHRMRFEVGFIEMMPAEHIVEILKKGLDDRGVQYLRIEDNCPSFYIYMDREQAMLMKLKMSDELFEEIRHEIQIIDFEEYYLPTK